MESNNSYTNILKYLTVFGGTQSIGLLIRLVQNKCIALLLGPLGIGLISLFTSITKFINETTNLGIPISAVRKISKYYEENDINTLKKHVSNLRSWALITALFGTTICVILSSILSKLIFNNNSHTTDIIILSPIIGLTTIVSNEIAILKGIRQLKRLSLLSVYSAITSIIISLPIIFLYREKGIVVCLLIVSILQTVITLYCSTQYFTFNINIKIKELKSEIDTIKLGLTFVITGILGSGADLLIRGYLNNASSTYIVGLYSTGYLITITYTSLIFSSIDTDYYPRLSAIIERQYTMIQTVNRQIEVTLLFASPILIAFSLFLPSIIKLLYSNNFLMAIPMIQVIIIAMFFKIINTPIEYVSLAKGDGRTFLILELIYNIILVILIIIGFKTCKLVGIGIGITVTNLINFILVQFYIRMKYNFHFTSLVKKIISIQIPLGLGIYMISHLRNEIIHYFLGITILIISSIISMYTIKSRT